MFYASEKPVFLLANVTASCLAGRWDYVDLFIQSVICINKKWKLSIFSELEPFFFLQGETKMCVVH